MAYLNSVQWGDGESYNFHTEHPLSVKVGDVFSVWRPREVWSNDLYVQGVVESVEHEWSEYHPKVRSVGAGRYCQTITINPTEGMALNEIEGK